MNHGLPGPTVKKIIAVLVKFPQVEHAVLFGSRATGNDKPGLNGDLTLIGNNLDAKELGKSPSHSMNCRFPTP